MLSPLSAQTFYWCLNTCVCFIPFNSTPLKTVSGTKRYQKVKLCFPIEDKALFEFWQTP